MSVKSWLRNWLLEPTRQELPSSLDAVMSRYEDGVSGFSDGADAAVLLSVLVQRDQVATALEKEAATSAIVQRLADLDHRLCQAALEVPDADWDAWRRSLNWPSERWWWRLDKAKKEKAGKGDLGWVTLASVIMVVTLGLAVEIIRRVWGGGPDFLSVFSSALTLVLTGSPLTKQGRELARWVMDKVPLPSHLQGETMLGMAFLALFGTAILFLMLPGFAVKCNNRGYVLLESGDLTGAQQAFARAVSINPDYAEAYYNLADAYVEIGNYDQARSLYNQALAADRTLDYAHNGLGHVLILQGKPESAIPVLYTGLNLTQNDKVRIALQTNLGRAYLEAGQFYEAEAALAEALSLNPEEAAAHCILALTAEAFEYPRDKVKEYWERCLGFAVRDTPREQELAAMARAHLRALEEER